MITNTSKAQSVRKERTKVIKNSPGNAFSQSSHEISSLIICFNISSRQRSTLVTETHSQKNIGKKRSSLKSVPLD